MVRDDINIPNEFDRLLDLRPFKPFTIVTSSGERHEVTHKHAAAVGQSVIILIAPAARTSTYLRLNQVASIEVPEQEL